MSLVAACANAVLHGKNFAPELSTFGIIASVNLAVVQWWVSAWKKHLVDRATFYAR